jgi:hypothetical protein
VKFPFLVLKHQHKKIMNTRILPRLRLFSTVVASALRRWSSVCAALVVTFVIAASCDEGLRPPPIPPVTSISGTVRYAGGRAAWPQRRDSVWTVRVVGFRQFPPMDLIGDILQGRAYFTPQALAIDSTLPLYADSAQYSLILPDEPPARIEYLCVAMLVDTAKLLTTAGWRVIGVYSTNANIQQSAPLNVVYGRDVRANITVDFRNPPPQPF